MPAGAAGWHLERTHLVLEQAQPAHELQECRPAKPGASKHRAIVAWTFFGGINGRDVYNSLGSQLIDI